VLTIPALAAQVEFATAYLQGVDAYNNADYTTAEQQLQASLHSSDTPPKSRGARVVLVSQQKGFYPEFYLALIYQQLQRYDEVLTYAEQAKHYISHGDSRYQQLISAENQARKALANGTKHSQVPDQRGFGVQPSTPDGADSGPGRMYALVIGIDHYTDKQAFPTLTTALDDAKAVRDLLRDRFGFEVRLLQDASRSEIVKALYAYRTTTDTSSSLLIYYAGHGYRDNAADKAYWIPGDAEASDPSNWVAADDITTEMKAIPARHVLVISDSCYSGGLARAANPKAAPADREHRDQYIRKEARDKSRTLLSSGKNEPVSDGGGGPNHSIFTGELLRALSQIEPNDFTAFELFNKVVEPVAGRSQQTPQYKMLQNSGHEDGDFVFRRKR